MSPFYHKRAVWFFWTQYLKRNKIFILSLFVMPLAVLFYFNTMTLQVLGFSFLPFFSLLLLFQTLVFGFEFMYLALIDSKQSAVYQRFALTRIGIQRFTWYSLSYFLILCLLSQFGLMLVQTFFFVIFHEDVSLLWNWNLPFILIISTVLNFLLLNFIFLLHNFAKTKVWQNILKGVAFFVLFSVLFIGYAFIETFFEKINLYFLNNAVMLLAMYALGTIFLAGIVSTILFTFNTKCFKWLH